MEGNNEGPRILVDWVPMPIGIGVDVPDGRLYQAAIAWLLEENNEGHVIARIKTTWQDSVSIGNHTVRHYVDGNQIWRIFLRHRSSFEINAAFGDWLASHLSNLDIRLTIHIYIHVMSKHKAQGNPSADSSKRIRFDHAWLVWDPRDQVIPQQDLPQPLRRGGFTGLSET